MATLTYDPAETLRQARDRYFEANGFGGDGGYSKKWEIIKIGPLPIPIRNTAGRVAAIRFHDLHHVIGGFDTDLAGEGEISAFELGGGCGSYTFAWGINFQGMLFGLRWPGQLLRGWVRGRRGRTLYHSDWDEALLDRTVGEVRHEMGLDVAPGPASVGERLSFGLTLLASVVVHVALIGGFLAAVGWGLGRLFGG
ncbi:MAG: hypothetical protein H6747_01580 [Deltaproteobacteria bacterium]|nr:hypothetical protein [Deltaproteobacteria bacterium]